jgi:hypothetical protein
MDLKETVKHMLDDFRRILHQRDVQKQYEELTQRIIVVMDAAKHKDSLEYYQNALMDEDKEFFEFNPLHKCRVD